MEMIVSLCVLVLVLLLILMRVDALTGSAPRRLGVRRACSTCVHLLPFPDSPRCTRIIKNIEDINVVTGRFDQHPLPACCNRQRSSGVFQALVEGWRAGRLTDCSRVGWLWKPRTTAKVHSFRNEEKPSNSRRQV